MNRRIFCRWIGGLAAVTGLALAADPPAPPPVEELFGLPQIRQPRLSPDGSKIAFLFPHEKKMALGVFDRATKESRMSKRSGVCGAPFSRLSDRSASPRSIAAISLRIAIMASQKRSSSPLASLSVGSIIMVSGTGQDMVGAWMP